MKRYFYNKLKPSKLTWTAMYRKQHKKRRKIHKRWCTEILSQSGLEMKGLMILLAAHTMWLQKFYIDLRALRLMSGVLETYVHYGLVWFERREEDGDEAQ